MSATKDRPALLRALTANKALKLLALLLAVVVWYGIREAISFETEVSDVPVTILHDEGWAVLDQTDTTVDIRFAGARADVRNIPREQVQVVVDARGQARSGLRTMPLRLDGVEAPPGARAVSIRPGEISFRLDAEGERQVVVKAELQGSLPEGFAVDAVACTPAAVLLRGPTSRLETVDLLRTVPIDLEGRIQSFKVRKPVVAPAMGWSSRVEPDRVLVEVTIAEQATARTVEGVPVRILVAAGVSRRVTVVPDTVAVSLRGRQDAVQALTADQVGAYIDCVRLEALARYELPVDVHLPPGIRAVTVEPRTVSVTVEEGHGTGRL